ERHWLGGHRRATVGVDGQLVAADTLLGARLTDQYPSERGTFATSDHPSDYVTGEDVQDHVQVVPAPLRRAAQLGDIPTPHLVRLEGDQLGFHCRWVAGLAPALPALAGLAQQPVEGRDLARGGGLVGAGGPHPWPAG